jgi:hypothetical protein
MVAGESLRFRQACRVVFWITVSPATSRTGAPSSRSSQISPSRMIT